MKNGEFFFDYVQLLYDKCHKTNPNVGRLYIDSSDWIQNMKATTNPINKKDKECFQYAVTVTLNFDEIKKRSIKNNKNKEARNVCKEE